MQISSLNPRIALQYLRFLDLKRMHATTSFLLAYRSAQAAQACPLLQLHLLRVAPSVGVGNLRGLHSTALSTASAATTKNWAVKYWEHGEAQEVLKVVQVPALDVSALGSTAVHVRMLAAPINPADINMAEGVYGIKPPLPATAGNEGHPLDARAALSSQLGAP